jgi:tetratricopeptide (TPR) repeat protein
VSLLEAGKRTPSLDVLAQLAKRLGCDLSELTGSPAVPSIGDLEVKLKCAEMALNNGDPQTALDSYRSVQGTATADAQPEIWYKAEHGVARALEHAGQLEEAVAHLENLRSVSVNRPDLVSQLTVVIALCRCYRELGDLTHAIELAEATLEELQKLQLEPTVIGVELLSTLVGVYTERGDLHRASYLATKAIDQAGSITDSRALGAAYWNASVVMHRKGNTADAVVLIEKALAVYAEGDDERALARLRNAYAMVLLQSETPQPRAAHEELERSLASLRSVGSSIDIAYCLSALARAELRLDNLAAAIEYAEEALRLLGTEHRLQSARNHLMLAAARLAQGDREAAQQACERGALMLEASEAKRQAGFAWAELAEILELCGEVERAVWAYRQSMRCMGHREVFLTGQPLTSRH